MKMSSSGMWHRVALQSIGVSEERVATVFRVERIRERGAALSVG
jgi:hypothetical protein